MIKFTMRNSLQWSSQNEHTTQHQKTLLAHTIFNYANIILFEKLINFAKMVILCLKQKINPLWYFEHHFFSPPS